METTTCIPPIAAMEVTGGTDLAPTTAEMVRWIKVLAGSDAVVELRAIGAGRTVSRRYTTDDEGLQLFVQDVRGMGPEIEGVYYVLNRLVGADVKGAAKDSDIASRRWLLIDVDPVKPTADASATDDEQASAWTVARSVREGLMAEGWPAPVVVDSGNGWHLYYRIELPGDDGGLVGRVLNALGDRFDAANARVDRRVGNASRIAKVPGTWARKGVPSDDRPHRVSRMVDEPADGPKVVPADALEAVASWGSVRPVEASANGAGRSGRTAVNEVLAGILAAPSGPNLSAEDRSILYAGRIDPAVSGQGGHGVTFRAACAIGPGFGLDPETALRVLRDHYNPRCDPPWSERELRHKVAEAYKVEARRGWLLDDVQAVGILGQVGESGKSAENIDAVLAGLPQTDLGNAERLVARFGRDLRYCPSWKSWLVWDGRRFAVDETGAVVRLAEKSVRAMLHEAATIDDADKRKALAGWQRASEGRARLESMIKLASTLEGVPVVHDDLDRDGWILNCRNGTVCLRTGELRPHDRADLITQLCPVDFDPDAKCPLWESTLALFFDGDQRLIAYWHRLCGYFLAGVTREHILPICYGTGANGKSTILGTLVALMGRDYALQAPPSMLASQRHESHPTVLADLFRKRLVVAIETEEGQTLNEALIKMLTGGDDIRARRLYQDHWSFSPTHTVVMATNHRPVIKGRDRGIWRRAKLIPFSVSLPPEQWDTTVKERLAAEHPGILAWAVRGGLAWQEVGLNEPETITRATEAYQQEQDVIGSFLAAVTRAGSSYRVKAGRLYETYRTWAERSGEPVLSLRKFGEAITERGFEKIANNGVWYLGIGLPEDVYEPA